MAACHPTPAIQHLQPQESSQFGLGPMNALGSQGRKPLHQPHYPPHLLNWVYLAIADQNSTQTRDQNKLVPTIWSGFSTTTSQTHSHHDTLDPSCAISGNFADNINELADRFRELGLLDRKPTKRPPPSYLCHLCFKKGHYIKDCPQRPLEKPDGLDVSDQSKVHPQHLCQKCKTLGYYCRRDQ